MRAIKRKWSKMANTQKVNLIFFINLFVIFIVFFMSIRLIEKFASVYMAILVFAGANVSVNLSLVIIVRSKEQNMLNKFKDFMFNNFFLWLFYSAYLCLLPFTLSSKFLLLLCFLYLEVAIEIWFSQFIYCRLFIKEYLSKRLLSSFNIKVVHSILIAINSWLIIVLNLRNINRKPGLWPVIYAIISSSTILFYPSFDIFEYMIREINKFAEHKQKEKIERESNGSKNYTVW